MTLAGTAGNGVGVDAIRAYDGAGGHRSIGEVEAALTSAGQRRIDKARRSGCRRGGWRTVGGKTAVTEVEKFCREADAIAGLIDHLGSIDRAHRSNCGGLVRSHAGTEKIGNGYRRNHQDNGYD